MTTLNKQLELGWQVVGDEAGHPEVELVFYLNNSAHPDRGIQSSFSLGTALHTIAFGAGSLTEGAHAQSSPADDNEILKKMWPPHPAPAWAQLALPART